MQHVFGRTASAVQLHNRTWRTPAVDLACALFGAVPLLLTAHIPLYDLPNHIAMLHVLLEQPADPALQHIYGVHWAFLPNMGLQVFVWLASKLMSVEAAVRVFCIITVLLLFTGTRALNLAFAGDDPAGPCARAYRITPLLYWGGPMQYGFVTYGFGVGLMLLALALYIRLHDRTWPVLIAIFGPIGLLLLATHLMAFGLFAAALAGSDLAEAYGRAGTWRSRAAWLGRRGAVVVSLLLPALIVWALAPKLQSSAAPGFTIDTFMSTLSQKLQYIAAITWFTMPWIEMPLLVSALLCLGLALVLKLVRFEPRMAGMAAVLALAWLALPRAVPASFFIDYRVPWAAAFVVLAGLLPGLKQAGLAQPGRLQAVVLTAAALVVVRIISISMHWLVCEPEMAALDQALAHLPHGANLLVVRAWRHGIITRTPPLEHEAAFYVTSRHGFEDEVFAGVAGQMVHLQPPYLPLYRLKPEDHLDSLPDAYQAVLILYPSLLHHMPQLRLRTVAQSRNFVLLER